MINKDCLVGDFGLVPVFWERGGGTGKGEPFIFYVLNGFVVFVHMRRGLPKA